MKKITTVVGFAAAIAAALVVAGCGSGSSSDNTVIVNGDVPLAYAKRAVTLNMNPTDGTPSAPGGDLIIREKSSPSAPAHNVTAPLHAGAGRCLRPRGVLRRQEDRLLDALPGDQHRHDRRRPGLHRPLEHLGIDMTTGGYAGGSFRA